MIGKKLFTLLFCSVLCLMLLPACGKQAEVPPQSQPTTVSTTPVSVEETAPTNPTTSPTEASVPIQSVSPTETTPVETVPTEPIELPELDDDELPPIPLW